jgi:hypothetical protein
MSETRIGTATAISAYAGPPSGADSFAAPLDQSLTGLGTRSDGGWGGLAPRAGTDSWGNPRSMPAVYDTAAQSKKNNLSENTPTPSDAPSSGPSGGAPPSASAPVTTGPACRFFQGAGQVGGALLGGTAEGLRQAAPGALAGGLAGATAGAGRGALAGAAAGVPESGVGALPGAGIGAVAGALQGGAAGAVLGGTSGFARGFQEGAGPGAAAGGSIGSWLDNTSLGRWVQGCPAPEADTPTTGPQVNESRGGGGDPGLTRPTGQVGGKPGEQRSASSEGATPKDKAQVDSENQVGGAFARAGYRTVQNPTEGSNPALTPERLRAEGLNPRARPDLLVENRIYDTYTPEADNANSIRKGIAVKIGERQTQRVAVDLRGTTQTEAAVRATLRAHPVPGLKEVVIIAKDGIGHPLPALTSEHHHGNRTSLLHGYPRLAARAARCAGARRRRLRGRPGPGRGQPGVQRSDQCHHP